MARVMTNAVSVAVADETSLGVLPGSPLFLSLEPNNVTTWGAKFVKVVRNFISKNRRRKKGAVVGVDSAVGLDLDLTWEHLVQFLPATMCSKLVGAAYWAGTTAPTAVTATGYTVPSLGAIAAGTLIYAIGFPDAANNGLKVVGAGSTSTEIKTSGLVVDVAIAPFENAQVWVCGVQGASGDVVMTIGGNITSTVLNWTTTPLKVGQYIKVGGEAIGTKYAVDVNKFARIAAITATQLTLDWRSFTPAADAGAGKTVQVLFGPWVRDVAVDDADFLSRSMCFESAWPNLRNPDGTGDEYEYADGNFTNELNLNISLRDKATMTLGFVGTDTPAPVTIRRSGGSTPRIPVRTSLFNTSSDMLRLWLKKLDETGETTVFKSLSLVMRNNVTPEPVLGQLAAYAINRGDFEVDVDAEALFTDSGILAAMRTNLSMGLSFGMRASNEDSATAPSFCGFMVDVPYVELADGARSLPENASVTVKVPMMADEDRLRGYTLSWSLFPYLPPSG